MSDYRDSHKGRGRGRVYDERYSRGYTYHFWQAAERPVLEKLFRDCGGPDLSCLDFACGTGRITELLVPYYRTVVGVDVSPDMIAEARRKLPGVEFIEQDLVSAPAPIGVFDVVAAFRFFPNAGRDLAMEAAKCLARQLRPEGLLICNNHQNAGSLLGRARRALGRNKRGFLSDSEMVELLESGGFRIVQRIGVGWMPVWREGWPLPWRFLVALEARTAPRGRLTGLANGVVYVARRSD